MDLKQAGRPWGTPVPIYAVHPMTQWAPLALGLMMAWLQDQRPEHCQLITPFATDAETLFSQIDSHGPGLILFSNYMWTREANLAISAAAKRHSPTSLIVHGGPDTPAYTDACTRYLQRYPCVDVAIHGAGEDTLLAVFDALQAGSPLSEVAGLAYLEKGQLVKTPSRPRLQDPNRYPSPYLTGLLNLCPGKNGQPLPWKPTGAVRMAALSATGALPPSKKFSVLRWRALPLRWSGWHSMPFPNSGLPTAILAFWNVIWRSRV